MCKACTRISEAAVAVASYAKDETPEPFEKYCSACKETKPSTEFYRRRSRASGRVGKCKTCRNVYHAKYLETAAGKASAKQSSQEYWQKYGKPYAQTEHGRSKIRRNADKYRFSEKGKRSARNYSLLKKYGITIDQYERLFEEQRRKCSICGDAEPLQGFHLDHCHTSGKVRGILCHRCNSGLGLYDDDIHKFELVIEYLKKHQS